MSPTYDVEIRYREPTFEIRGPKRDEPFSWTYAITTSSPHGLSDRSAFLEKAAEHAFPLIQRIGQLPILFRHNNLAVDAHR